MTKIRMALVVALAVVVAAGSLVPATAGKKKKKAKGPMVVATDAPDDWGANADPTLTPAGGPLASELVKAAINKPDAKTIEFIIELAELPPPGGIPEFVRYVWTMDVDGDLIQLDGKFTNYSRGACDPTAGTCPPPRDPGMAPFTVRGNCVSSGAAVTCDEVALVNATFDSDKATITIPVPLDSLGAKPGSRIMNGTQPDSGFSGVLSIPSVLFSQTSMPLDEMIMTKTYVVPK